MKAYDESKRRFWNTVTILNLFLSIMICIYHNNGYAFYDDGTLSRETKFVIDIIRGVSGQYSGSVICFVIWPAVLEKCFMG